jgi:hypothetical protein
MIVWDAVLTHTSVYIRIHMCLLLLRRGLLLHFKLHLQQVERYAAERLRGVADTTIPRVVDSSCVALTPFDVELQLQIQLEKVSRVERHTESCCAASPTPIP